MTATAPAWAIDTPDRPGRPMPGGAGQPAMPPTSQPAPTTLPTAQSAGDIGTDEDFLNQTAGDLGIRPPAQRPDEQILKWFGLRPRLESDGITFVGTVTMDYSKNFRGGIDTSGDAFRHLLDLRINVDTQPLFKLKGGTFSIDFQNQNGQNGTDKLTGDVQGFDNADADGRTQISELWYQQTFFDQRCRVKIGKVDANSEFAFPEYGAAFMNSSFGHSPTLFAMPTYPDGAMSVNVFIYPTPWSYAGAGVYDGSGAAGVNTGDYGPQHFFRGDDGYFAIGEAGIRWVFAEDTMPGRFAVGGWGSTSDFSRLTGGGSTTSTGGTAVGTGTNGAAGGGGGTAHGTGGEYAMLEQTLWHKNYYDKTNPDGIAAFVQYGHSDPHLSGISDYVASGITWTGPFERRKNDIVGVGLAYVNLGTDPGSGFTKHTELSVEGFYSFQALDYLLIKPDIQWITDPGGTNAKDAVVATLRATIAF